MEEPEEEVQVWLWFGPEPYRYVGQFPSLAAAKAAIPPAMPWLISRVGDGLVLEQSAWKG